MVAPGFGTIDRVASAGLRSAVWQASVDPCDDQAIARGAGHPRGHSHCGGVAVGDQTTCGQLLERRRLSANLDDETPIDKVREMNGWSASVVAIDGCAVIRPVR